MQWYEVQLKGCVTSIFHVYSSACPAYPTTYDKSDGSPRPPIGHGIAPQQGNIEAEFTELSNKQCHTQHLKQ